MGTELVMNTDTNMVTDTAIRMPFLDWVTKMLLNPTALKKFTVPMAQGCTKASMPAMMLDFVLDLATSITVITGSSGTSSGVMMTSIDLRASRI